MINSMVAGKQLNKRCFVPERIPGLAAFARVSTIGAKLKDKWKTASRADAVHFRAGIQFDQFFAVEESLGGNIGFVCIYKRSVIGILFPDPSRLTPGDS